MRPRIKKPTLISSMKTIKQERPRSFDAIQVHIPEARPVPVKASSDVLWDKFCNQLITEEA